jgi:DNA repair protein RadD
MSTGSGKSLVCAMMAEQCLKQGKRALILVPSHELVLQNYNEHYSYTVSALPLGICSAKLQKAQVQKQIVYATYTSFLRRRATSGLFNLLIIDECHYLNPDPDTSYQKIIKSLLRINPDMRIIGLTATPYRADQGMLHQDCIKGKAIFTKMAYETNIPDLIKQGYLSHVESISGEVEADMTDVKLKGQDYDTELAAVKFDAIVVDAVIDMKVKFAAYKISTAIVYASNLANARRIIEEWDDSATIRLAFGDMSTHDRNALTTWLREGNGLRVVVNVGLFVTGFDYRALDCVVFFVATKSLVKYVQIAGRVIRSHEEKELGYVLDYGGNIERHGPIDATIPPKNKKRKDEAPRKPCLECGEANILNAKKCKECGAEFISEGTEGGYSMRTKAQALALKQHHRHEITSVLWESAFSNKSSLPMIKGLFYDDDSLVYTHYLCLEHPGFAGENSKRFLMSMFKDKKDYFLLGKTHINCKNILALLNEAPKFFKTIKSIELHDREDSRFKELKKVIYEN